MNKLKHFPFCGESASTGIGDEGNPRDEEHEFDTWSGISFTILHGYNENKGCPIANHNEDGAVVGILLYESGEEVVKVWNTRFN